MWWWYYLITADNNYLISVKINFENNYFILFYYLVILCYIEKLFNFELFIYYNVLCCAVVDAMHIYKHTTFMRYEYGQPVEKLLIQMFGSSKFYVTYNISKIL